MPAMIRLAAAISALFASAMLPAAEIEGTSPSTTFTVQTESGTLYQLQSSSDLETFTPEGPFKMGTGERQTVSLPFASPSAFYRVTEVALDNLNAELETLRQQIGVPGLAAAVVQDNELSAIGVAGQRRFGTDAPVQFADRWHMGSLTKSMTATLAAVLIEDGIIEWDTTIGEVFPDAEMAAGWEDVTLAQLLSNSGGAPGDLNVNGIWTTLWNFQGLPRDGRRLLLDEVTALPLRYTPGTNYEYSNAGFAIAGAMMEELTDTPWESLITQELFIPLGMHSASFGPPATPRLLNHPVGHGGNAANPTIYDPNASADNPAAIGPAGTVNASIADMARYIQFHLLKGEGESSLLSPASFEVLHSSDFGFDYAKGWLTADRPWAGGIALQHTGSNTQWFANIWIAPEVDWACIVCTNFGGTSAFEKSDQVVGYLLQNYGP